MVADGKPVGNQDGGGNTAGDVADHDAVVNENPARSGDPAEAVAHAGVAVGAGLDALEEGETLAGILATMLAETGLGANH